MCVYIYIYIFSQTIPKDLLLLLVQVTTFWLLSKQSFLSIFPFTYKVRWYLFFLTKFHRVSLSFLFSNDPHYCFG